MLSKRPTFSTNDLHKSALGHHNPLYLKSAQLCRPTLYLGDVIVDPVHTPFRVYDSEETLVQAEVSRTKMLEKMKDPVCKVSSKPINYAKLNSLYDTFVPQKQLSSEQVYWLPANEVASYNCIEDNLFKEVSEYMKIFDKEYDQCVIDKKSLEIENKNLLIQNECLLAESVSKDICSVVLTSNIVVPMSVEPRSNYVKEHSRNLELEAEILKMKQLLLKDQLQEKDKLIRKLKDQIGNMKENDSLRDENMSIKKRYQDLYQSKAESNSNVSCRAAVLEKPKVLAPGLYAMTPKYSSNDMVHNHYLDEAKKQTHEIGKNSKSSVIPYARSQSTANSSKPKPRINNQKSRNWPASKTSTPNLSAGLEPNSMAPGHNGEGPEINNLQLGRIGSGLVTTPTTPTAQTMTTAL
ncbi:hypothetical protein Tco_1348278 [Tanacetum coccineum]